ncbi:MAG: cupin domain-containing protein [Parafilimonas terrae]|jgi:transcriptional regulator with XRE-family HTH domain|nr:cupin domain-containing protein [Parafilimonas terrae]
MAKIGPKLRELRTRRALGMRELAVRSGVSHSAISLIERDRMSPTLDTLGAILDALGTTLAAFFTDLQADPATTPFYSARDFVEIGRSEAISYRMIGVNHPNRDLLMLHETYAAGAETGQAVSHAAQEAGMVVRGAVELTVGQHKRVLEAGDGYYFDSQMPHRFRNVADGTSEIVSAVTPLTY